jgi:hypothetical protein
MLNTLLQICDLAMGKSVSVLLSADEIRKSNLLESLKGVIVVTEERGLRMCGMLGRHLLISLGNVVEGGKSEFEDAVSSAMRKLPYSSFISVTCLLHFCSIHEYFGELNTFVHEGYKDRTLILGLWCLGR